MLIFRAQLNPNYKPTNEEMMAMKQAWGSWIGGFAQNARLVSSHQLGFQGRVIKGNEIASNGYLKSEEQSISGNLVIKAESIEEAEEMAKGCPILNVGGSVEIRNTLAVH